MDMAACYKEISQEQIGDRAHRHEADILHWCLICKSGNDREGENEGRDKYTGCKRTKRGRLTADR